MSSSAPHFSSLAKRDDDIELPPGAVAGLVLGILCIVAASIYCCCPCWKKPGARGRLPSYKASNESTESKNHDDQTKGVDLERGESGLGKDHNGVRVRGGDTGLGGGVSRGLGNESVSAVGSTRYSGTTVSSPTLTHPGSVRDSTYSNYNINSSASNSNFNAQQPPLPSIPQIDSHERSVTGLGMELHGQDRGAELDSTRPIAEVDGSTLQNVLSGDRTGEDAGAGVISDGFGGRERSANGQDYAPGRETDLRRGVEEEVASPGLMSPPPSYVRSERREQEGVVELPADEVMASSSRSRSGTGEKGGERVVRKPVPSAVGSREKN